MLFDRLPLLRNSPDPNMVIEENFRRLEQLLFTAGVPVGGLIPFYGTVAPAGWLICDGSTFSSTTYPALAAHLGGTTLPNIKGKVIVGLDAAQGEFNTLGETGGEKTHVLLESEMPSHNHEGDLGLGNTSLDGDHDHFYQAGLGGGDVALTPGISNYNLLEETKTTDTAGDHTHNLATNGSDAAHNNLQPYIAVPYIIRAA